jgi:LysM repeat protein
MVRLHHPSRGVPAPVVLAGVERADAGYRMGRWARLSLTVTVLATAVVVVAALTAGSPSSRLVDVTVGPGDSLWSIATSSAPDRDPRAVIDEIRQLNDVSGEVLPVGVVLRVPASDE